MADPFVVYDSDDPYFPEEEARGPIYSFNDENLLEPEQVSNQKGQQNLLVERKRDQSKQGGQAVPEKEKEPPYRNWQAFVKRREKVADREENTTEQSHDLSDPLPGSSSEQFAAFGEAIADNDHSPFQEGGNSADNQLLTYDTERAQLRVPQDEVGHQIRPELLANFDHDGIAGVGAQFDRKSGSVSSLLAQDLDPKPWPMLFPETTKQDYRSTATIPSAPRNLVESHIAPTTNRMLAPRNFSFRKSNHGHVSSQTFISRKSEHQYRIAKPAAVSSAIDSKQSPQLKSSFLDSGEGSNHRSRQKKPMSSLRRFLDSNEQFYWPREGDKNDSSHRYFVKGPAVPLQWQRKLGENTNVFCGDVRLHFKKPFVVKIIRDRGNNEEVVRRAGFLETIRHPHCIAHLGSYTYSNDFYILMFPVAQCNLRRLMDDIYAERHQSTKTPAYEDKTRILCRCFVCLAQALSFIHNSGILQKDICPESILVDESGSVLLTPIGKSRSHSSFYAQNGFRGEKSWNIVEKASVHFSVHDQRRVQRELNNQRTRDISSLGLVLLEAATLVLWHDLERLHARLRVSREKEYFYPLMNEWIDDLERLGPIHKDKTDLDTDRDVRMIGALPTIRGMLEAEPEQRPEAHGLWEKFKNVSLEICADCDPRHPDVWSPRALASSEAANTNSSVQSAND